MDIETLRLNKNNWISLSDNDKKRLAKLSDKNPLYKDVVNFMLENDCKLEQEIISWKE